MITIENVVKRFSKKCVVDHVTLDIPKGMIFGLLGPNGAGKTTLLRMICGIVNSDEGIISINGKTIDEAKRDFGYVSQYFGQYEELTVWENVLFYAKMYGVDDETRLQALLVRYNLERFKDTQAGALSGGYKRRLALVCALSHDPLVLFLDEPTAGIDPVTRKQLWDDFYALSMEGKTLFVTTHYMEEAERCEALAFLAQGRVVAEGTPETIKKSLGNVRLFTLGEALSPKVTDEIAKIKGVVLLNRFGNQLRIMVNEQCDVGEIVQLLKEKTGNTLPLQEDKPNIEDTFIALTQDKAR